MALEFGRRKAEIPDDPGQTWSALDRCPGYLNLMQDPNLAKLVRGINVKAF